MNCFIKNWVFHYRKSPLKNHFHDYSMRFSHVSTDDLRSMLIQSWSIFFIDLWPLLPIWNIRQTIQYFSRWNISLHSHKTSSCNSSKHLIYIYTTYIANWFVTTGWNGDDFITLKTEVISWEAPYVSFSCFKTQLYSFFFSF